MTKKKLLIVLNSRNSQIKKIKTDSAYLKLINLMKSNFKIPSILINHNLLCKTFTAKKIDR